MRLLLTHLWKEWRAQRAVLIGILIAIPVVTLATFVGLTGLLARAGGAVPVFVGGSAALAALALATELFAGESSRGTLGFLRRQPGGLRSAWTAKVLAYVLGILLASAWGSACALASARIVGGEPLASGVWNNLAGDGVTWWIVAGVATLGAWTMLVSTWIPRGAAAAGGALLLLGVLCFPAFLSFGEYPKFLVGRYAMSLPVALVLFAAPIGVSALCVLRGHRFAGGAWRAAWRGLAVVLLLGAGGYAHASREFDRYVRVDPASEVARLSSAFLGRGGHFAFVNVHRQDDDRLSRPIRVDLRSGRFEEIGELDDQVYPAWPLPVALARGLGGGYEVLEVAPSGFYDAAETVEGYYDGESGEEIGRFLGHPMAPVILDRLRRSLRRSSPVRYLDGRRAWWLDGRLEREGVDGSIETVGVPEGWSGHWCYPWGFMGMKDQKSWAVDAWDGAPVARLRAWETGNAGDRHPWGGLDADQYVRRVRAPKSRTWEWRLSHASNGTSVPAPGMLETDQRIDYIDVGVVLAWNAPRADALGTLARVEPLVGARRPVASAPGVPAQFSHPSVHTRTATGRFVLKANAGERGADPGFLFYDPAANRIDTWVPTGGGWDSTVGADSEDSVVIIEGMRRIVRLRGTTREILFPR